VFDDERLSLDRTGHVAAAVSESLRDPRFSTARIAAAFAQESAVEAIRNDVAARTQPLAVEIVVGVDFGSTSQEALEALVASDIDAALFSADGLTYHPKVYYFAGADIERAIVGSANLTEQGLNQNLEAAIVVEATREECASVFTDLVGFLNEIATHSSPLTGERVSALVADGIVGPQAETHTGGGESTGSRLDSESALDELQAAISRQALDSAFSQSTEHNRSEASGDDDPGDEEGTEPESAGGRETARSVPAEPAALALPARHEMPPIPSVTAFETKTQEDYYSQLVNDPENQPSRMRRLIRARGEMTQGELKDIMRTTYGYSISGSFGASLQVLIALTEEVSARGQGPDRQLMWTGE
jgi:HKD family nuclease